MMTRPWPRFAATGFARRISERFQIRSDAIPGTLDTGDAVGILVPINRYDGIVVEDDGDGVADATSYEVIANDAFVLVIPAPSLVPLRGMPECQTVRDGARRP